MNKDLSRGSGRTSRGIQRAFLAIKERHDCIFVVARRINLPYVRSLIEMLAQKDPELMRKGYAVHAANGNYMVEFFELGTLRMMTLGDPMLRKESSGWRAMGMRAEVFVDHYAADCYLLGMLP